MTLLELSREYAATGVQLSARLRVLRAQLRQCAEPEERFRLQRRIYVLTEILTQTHELTQLTAHYYERGYWRNEKYTV